MGRKNSSGEPTLAQAWTMLGDSYGLTFDECGERSIRAHGSVRGREVIVEIDGGAARGEFWRFLSGVNTISSRNRREKWHSVLSVGCANPAGVAGTIESAVDVRDPAWNPREYNPRNGRKVRTDPAALSALALTAETRERLMSITDDVRIDVRPDAVRLDHRSTALPGPGATYVAGSIIHHYQGDPQPWPQRALAGPPWWIDLLCDLADAIDG